MKEKSLAIYRRYSPGFTQVEGEKDYWEGECPFCGSEDGFKAWGDNEYFLCLDCQVEGDSEDFMRAMKTGQSEEESNKPLNPEISDNPRLGKILQSEEKNFSQNQGDNDRVEEKKTVASSEMRMKENLLILLRRISPLNLSGKELMIVVFLYLFPRKFKATIIGKLLRIPEKNIHRVLVSLEEIGIISSTGERPLEYTLSSKLRQSY